MSPYSLPSCDSAICRAILIWINPFGIHVIIPAQAWPHPVTKIHIFTFHCHMAFGTNRITCFVREHHDLFYWHLQPIASKHPKHSRCRGTFLAVLIPALYILFFLSLAVCTIHLPPGGHTSYHSANLPVYDSGPF